MIRMGLPPSKEPGDTGGAGGLADIGRSIVQANQDEASDENRKQMRADTTSGGRGRAKPRKQQAKAAPAHMQPPSDPEPTPTVDDELDATMWDRITRLELQGNWLERYSRNIRTLALGAFLLAACLLAVFVIFRFRMLGKIIENAVKAAPKVAAAV